MTIIHSKLGKEHAQHMKKQRRLLMLPRPMTYAEKVEKQIKALRVQHDRIPVSASMSAAKLSKNVEARMALRSQMSALSQSLEQRATEEGK